MYPDSLYDAFAVLALILLILSACVFVMAIFLPTKQRNKLLQRLWRKWII